MCPTQRPSWSCAGAAALAVILLTCDAVAQTLDRPAAARRVVRVWSFDDPNLGVDPIPAGWFRAQDNVSTGRSRPGFPSFNIARLDFDTGASGEVSVMLPTQGGSTALRLAAGTLAAIPEGDYVVSTRVRTEGLRVARARLSTWLVDEQRLPIQGTHSQSRLALTGGEWETISAPIRGHAQAAWIQIELELLQPEQFQAPPHLEDHVLEEDVSGAAWFDDVSVYQAPRLIMATQSPVNIIEAPGRPELSSLVRDLTGEALDVDLFVIDLDGHETARHRVSLPMAAKRTIWEPELPGFGWYRAVMQVRGRTGLVGQRHVDFIWTPPLRALDPLGARAFGLIAESLPGALHDRLPQLMRDSGLGAIQLAVWRRGASEGPGDEELGHVTRAAERLLNDGVDVTFVLAQTPEALASRARVDRENPLPVLAGDDLSWIDSLGDVLTRFGERAGKWQLGATGTIHPFFRPDLAREVQITHERLSRLVPRPHLALPWGGDQAMRPDLGPVTAITTSWPVGVPPRWASGLVSELPEGVDTRLVIETIDPQRFGMREATNDLARRCAEAWAVGFDSISIEEPWSVVELDGQAALMPDPALAVFITMAQQLAGREIVGTFDAGDGVRALILRHADRTRGLGSLIAWNDSAPSPRAMLHGYLGDHDITVIDPFGNSSKPRADARRHYAIEIDQTPVFIDGVDVDLAQFRSGLRVEPGFIPARAERHEVELVIENPWEVSINGRLRIGEPEDWSISPRVLPFALDSGERTRIPMNLSFNLGEEAGPREMVAQLELLARQRYPVQEIRLDVEIGLPAVELSAGYRIDAPSTGSEADVIVTLRISNRTDEPLTLEAFAHASGYRRDFRPISGLAPGESTMRFFRFPGGAERLAGKNVRVGIKEQDGTGRLNKTIRIDPRQPGAPPRAEGD